MNWHSLISLLMCVLSMIASIATAKESGLQRSTIGHSVLGKPIDCEVHGDGPDVLMVLATIHGNEAAGTPLLAAFAEWLTEHPEALAGHKVVLIPVANPDGMAAHERFNSRGVDLNRNFPAGNWDEAKVNLHGEAPLSEPESRALLQAIAYYFPDRIVSIHQPLDCVDYDGPAKKLAEAMAGEGPLPVKKLGGLPGSLGSFVGESMKKPIITWELPKDAGSDPQELWKTYGNSLIAAIEVSVMPRIPNDTFADGHSLVAGFAHNKFLVPAGAAAFLFPGDCHEVDNGKSVAGVSRKRAGSSRLPGRPGGWRSAVFSSGR